MRFRYLHRLHWRRKVTPRRHPIPDPVQIVLQICLEVLDRAPVHSWRSLVSPDSLIRLPHEPLRNDERLSRRLRFAHPIPPRNLWLPERTSHGRPGPFAPPPLPGFPHYYEPVRMPAPRRYSIPHGFSRLRRSLSPPTVRSGRVGASLPTFCVQAADRARVAYMPGTA